MIIGGDEPPEGVLIENDGATPYKHKPVIDLAEVRLAYGIRRSGATRCEHRRLLYNPGERLIECTDCATKVDPFDAFMVLTEHFQAMERDHAKRQDMVDRALAATLNRRMAKKIDHVWSGNEDGVACPFCSRGLFAEDFERGVTRVPRELEIERRRFRPQEARIPLVDVETER